MATIIKNILKETITRTYVEDRIICYHLHAMSATQN